MWITPAGTIDEGGVEQPAYLNFDVSLLGPPSSNEMQVWPQALTWHVHRAAHRLLPPARLLQDPQQAYALLWLRLLMQASAQLARC